MLDAPTRSHAPVRPYSLLLVEPYFVLRRTVASVASGLAGVTVMDAPNLEAAGQMLSFRRFDGLVVALDGHDHKAVLDLIGSIRSGGTPSPRDACVAVTAEQCDMATIEQLRELQVKRILIKPFKVKTVLETVAAFAHDAGAAPGAALSEAGRPAPPDPRTA